MFPRETYRQPKDEDKETFPYTTYPTIAVTSVERSWATAKKKAGWILAGRPHEADDEIEPLECRFYDLRHTAVTRMIKAGVPIPIIAQLVGLEHVDHGGDDVTLRTLQHGSAKDGRRNDFFGVLGKVPGIA